MKYRLVHLSGSLAGRVREVNAPTLVLGRDPDAAQVVFGSSDNQVSRRHALLEEQGGVLVLRDLDSSTGTFVDGEDVEEAEILDGDVIELGRGGPRLRVEFLDAGTLVVEAPHASVPPSAPLPARIKAPAPGPASKLRLTFVSGTRTGSFVELAGSVFRIGRAQGSAVWTPDDRIVSAQHAKIFRLEDGYVLLDLESRNGTLLNGRKVERAQLQDGDTIGLGPGGPELRVQILAPDLAARTSLATIEIPNFAALAARHGETVFLRDVDLDRDTLTIGRAETAELRLDAPIVSKSHARIARRDGAFSLEDLGSSNGTYLNDVRVDERVPLKPGDLIVVGPFQLEVAAARLRVLDTRSRARLDAREVDVAAGERALVEDVSLSLPPGSFTALIGPSGAGKSTLLSALSGARPLAGGQVTLNGHDLHRTFAALKASIGYVPQEDIVHRELSVGQSLTYTAQLRLPSDTSPAERERRIAEVLATLELTERRDVQIQRLSGGQRKRVSIATELLTEPALLFLDEPTSGLDPGLEEALMLLLRELSYKGKTVVLVTHTLDHIHLCDAVVLLAGGRLAFIGKAAEAREYFGIEQTAQLYSRLRERTPTEWEQAFRKTAAHDKLVVEPLAELPPPVPRRSATTSKAAGPGGWRQLAVLAGRYFTTVTRDARNAAMLVGQAPLIAALIGLSLLYGQSDIAYTKPKNTILFLLALTAVWFGCSNAARELVKERAIYVRERMVNLKVLPYVASKALVLGGVACVQCVVFLVILDLWFGIPGQPLLLFGAMLLASVVGILLGLALSALAQSADRAMTLLPILLIPQVLFTVPAVQMDMKGPAGLVARAMPTWWAFDLLRRVAIAPGLDLDDDACEASLRNGEPALMTKARFERMLQEGYMLFNFRGLIEVTWTASLPDRIGASLPAFLGPWRAAVADVLALTGFAAALLATTLILQSRKGFGS